MSLAFLTPDAVGDAVARSPMERLARAAGARIEVREGWNVATAYGDADAERRLLAEGVGFADRSNLLKLELQAEPATLAAVVEAASGGAHALEPGSAVRANGAWWCPVTPTRVLVLGDPEHAARIRLAVSDACADIAAAAAASATATATETVTVADLTSGLAALTLSGPASRELLARFCAIDVRPGATPVGAFRPGSVARTPGYLLREGEDRLLVLVGWALGHYLWTVVADAAEHLGGGPVGADALT
ncbi:MAG TPA: sarcosine oxidase subunit gamma family protein [Solirubrobacteraceae bacterium]|nr:sarcosine oxidase subunit gamma family protein [Solirubrobacteraceae bacterium]